MSISESAANAAADAALLVIQTAANAEFIANADAAINEAVAQGKYKVYLSSVKNMNFPDVFTHYRDLGYVLGPTARMSSRCNPAALFGQFWVDYWNNVWNMSGLDDNGLPYQIVISWNL